jgi:hypothetical protein
MAKTREKQSPPQNSLEQAWTPFFRCHDDPRDLGAAIFKNSRYQVHIRRIVAKKQPAPDMVHVSLRRIDRGTLIPYRDIMRIKRELLHPEIELTQIYPAESREVDQANQYHFWGVNDVFYRFPFGFDQGRIVGDGTGDGGVQTPYEEDNQPDDWLSRQELLARIARQDKEK